MTVAKHAEHAECQNMLLDPRTYTRVPHAACHCAFDASSVSPARHLTPQHVSVHTLFAPADLDVVPVVRQGHSYTLHICSFCSPTHDAQVE